ncbi:hypothetical protein LCGC14_2708900, partial [marine sediment metagenome]
TMVYPFGLMIAGSTKSGVDATESNLVPRFLTDDGVLWAKHVEGLFNESLAMMRQVYNSDAPSFGKVSPPESPNRALVEAWLAFLGETDLPTHAYTIGYLEARTSRGTVPKAARAFKRAMVRRFDGDIHRLNRELGTQFVAWNRFVVRRESFLLRRETPGLTGFYKSLQDFKAESALHERYYFTIEGFFKQYLKTQYTRDIARYNAEHGTAYTSYDQVHLDRRVPDGPGRTHQQRKDWEELVRHLLSPMWIRVDARAAPLYRELLEAKRGSLSAVNQSYGTSYKSFDAIGLIQDPPAAGAALADQASPRRAARA